MICDSTEASTLKHFMHTHTPNCPEKSDEFRESSKKIASKCDVTFEWYHSYYILQSGKTPLHDASQWSNEQVIKTLIKAGADVNTADEVSYIKHHGVITYEKANNGTYMQ